MRDERDPAGDVSAVAQALAAPFDAGEIKWKPQTISGNRALAICFVDARVIQDRLDEVLGVMGWQDDYECLPDGAVVCKLRVRIGGEWITKVDVGGQSEQPDEGDRRKAAFSDALKRAAVKFGIARYLYRLKPQWVDYDPQRRQLLRTPPPPGAPPAKAERPAATNGQPGGPEPGGLPVTPRQQAERYEAQLITRQLCATGELLAWLEKHLGTLSGSWDRDDVAAACKKFWEGAKARAEKQKEAAGAA